MRICLLTCLLALLLTSAAAAQVRLRGDVVVAGPTLQLGDLFEGVGEKADRAVAPAPPPGRQFVYRRNQLAALARAHGLAWSETSGPHRIVVTGAASPELLTPASAPGPAAASVQRGEATVT